MVCLQYNGMCCEKRNVFGNEVCWPARPHPARPQKCTQETRPDCLQVPKTEPTRTHVANDSLTEGVPSFVCHPGSVSGGCYVGDPRNALREPRTLLFMSPKCPVGPRTCILTYQNQSCAERISDFGKCKSRFGAPHEPRGHQTPKIISKPRFWGPLTASTEAGPSSPLRRCQIRSQ